MSSADTEYLKTILKSPEPARAEDAAARSAPQEPALDPAQEPEVAPGPEAERRLALRQGRTLVLLQGKDEERLTLRAPDGQVELSVRITPEGPVLSFNAADLELNASRRVSVTCDQLQLRSRKAMELTSGGTVRVRGEDNVWVDGENVLLNCEGEEPPEQG